LGDIIKREELGRACDTCEKINVYSDLIGKSDGKSHLEDLDIGGRMILK